MHRCGPCRASKPQLEQLAQKYASDMTKDIKFGIVYESDLGESIHQYSIRAFPTYVLFQNGRESNRVEGVNMAGIETMIQAAATSMAVTGGHTLSGDDGGPTLTPEQARAARLAKLAGGTSQPTEPPAVETPKPKEPAAEEDIEMKEAPAAAATAETKDEGDAKMEDATENAAEEMEMVDPTAGLDPEAIKTLTESMGFTVIRAQKGLLYGNAKTVEAAVEWLMEHQEDADIDEPIAKQSVKAQSYKCNECGKILSNMANLELHANKTGQCLPQFVVFLLF